MVILNLDGPPAVPMPLDGLGDSFKTVGAAIALREVGYDTYKTRDVDGKRQWQRTRLFSYF